MTLNHVKLGRTVKYLASAVSYIFALKTLIWNKTMFIASNSLNLTELVKNELIKLSSKIFENYN